MAMNYGAPMGEDATIVLSGIGTELSDGMLMNMYRTYGPIVRVRHNGSNSAQVIFEQKQHALRAVEATNGAVVYGKSLKVKLQRQFKKTSEPCRGFAAGICRKGDQCKYYHVTDNAAFAAVAPPVVAKAPREKKKKEPKAKPTQPTVVSPEIQAISGSQVCRHFSRGYCSRGAECLYAHVMGLPKPDGPAPTEKTKRPCLFYQSGVCTRGDACRFVHEPKAGAATETKASTPAKSPAVKAPAQSDSSEGDSKQKEETRTCIECEKPGVAVWKCAKCDNSLYCDDCNSAVHRARVMAKHKRSKLPALPKLPRCGECESKPACVRCEQCEVPFCASCDASVHKFKSLQKHVRVELSGKSEKAKPKAKEPKEQPKVVKKKEEKKTQAKAEQEHVPYVESVPQLAFSSDSESESEDEKMPEAAPAQSRIAQVTSEDDEPMAAAASSSETESEDDFDDVKPQSSTPVTSTAVVTEQPHESESESEEDVDDTPVVKATPHAASVPKMELSSDSDSSDDEAAAPVSTSKEALPSKSTPPAVLKPSLAELSSESESDSDDEAPSKPVVKKAKKSPAKKPTPAESSSKSEDEAPVKPAPKPVVQKSSSSSSSSESSSSESSDSEDEAPPAKPVAKPSPAPRRAPAPAQNHKAGGISDGSSHTLVKKIEAFNASGEGDSLHLDANLNGFERLLAHDCAERLGLAHESVGAGLERHIIISRHSAKHPAAASASGHKAKKSKHHH